MFSVTDPALVESDAEGVVHPASATVFRLLSLFPAALLPFCAGVPAIGVGHPAKYACRGSWSTLSLPSRCATIPGVSFQSRTVGVTHPVISVSDVRRTDARRRERDTPEGVTQGFQVSVYKVDPYIDVFARNLLSKDDCRLALRDEVPKSWPEVPLVSKPSSLACRAERLARTGTGPNRSIVAPTGTPERKGPHADAGKKMALGEVLQVGWVYIFNTPGVNHAVGNVPGCDQVAQPLGCIRVDFVVIGAHAASIC